jgi:hypothetical protein
MNRMNKLFKGRNIKKDMKKEMKIGLLVFVVCLVTFSLMMKVSASVDSFATKIDSGYVLIIDKIEMQPEFIAPGQSGVIKVILSNNAGFELNDVMVQINLPSEIKSLNSINKKKINKIGAGETVFAEFSVISLPNAAEGMYNATISTNYLSSISSGVQPSLMLFQESNAFGILVIKSTPKIFTKVDTMEIYQGSDTGKITATFVNNNLANLKFLTVELLDSSDYKVLSPNKEYIGSLDSDDFQSVDFNIKINQEKAVLLKFKISYMDSLNKEYSEEVETPLKILSAAEIGKAKSNTSTIVVLVLIIAIAAYYFYKKYQRKKKKEEKYT